MTLSVHHGGWVIALSLIGAMALTIVPLPQWAEHARPEWCALVLIYWSLALPDRVGIGVGWVTGLLVDVLTDALMGEHALGFAVVAYATMKVHRRTRLAPVWQQAGTVLVLLSMQLLVSLWIRGMTGRTDVGWGYWSPAVVGMICWPAVFYVLRLMRRRLGVR